MLGDYVRPQARPQHLLSCHYWCEQFFYLESASFIVTFLRLSLRWRQTWGIVAFALLLEVVLQVCDAEATDWSARC